MRIRIFYFSGTGNTWWVANELKTQLISIGHDTEILSIESKPMQSMEQIAEIVNKCDIIGLAYPIYGSACPDIMKRFVRTLPEQKKEKFAFSLCTQMTISGNGGIYIKDILDDRGYTLKWATHFIMPCNVDIPPLMILNVPSRVRINKILEAATNKASTFIGKIIANEQWIEGQTVIDDIYTSVARGMFSIEFPRYKKLLFCDEKRCTQCGLCSELCPVSSIVKTPKGVKFTDNCMFCLRCYSYCPAKAINMDLTIVNTKDFIRYKGPVLHFEPKILKE
jgi:ferredoxin/flavodoxin